MSHESTSSKKRVLLIAANPAVSETTGWPVGFWWAELTHPFAAFTEAGYEVEIRSPLGGSLAADSYSDPEDPSGYSAHDTVSLGFKKSPKHAALLADTKSIEGVSVDAYDALFVVGGQSPMVTFRGNAEMQRLVAAFYEAHKPTALVCHGTCLLLEAKLSNDKLLVEGKTWTGFADAEEEFADKIVGKRIQPFWIEQEARKIAGTTFATATAFRPFAVRDGHLVTGQQQSSGRVAAELVIELLESASRPTGVRMYGTSVEIDRFTHPFFQANAWLVMNDTHAILIDTASNGSADADRVVDFVRRSGRALQAVVLSHGHPDIWLGVKRLREAFPEAPIYTATAAVREDIVTMGKALEEGGMLANTPELAPSRYDYAKAIRVLDKDELKLDGALSVTLKMKTTSVPSEYTHLTTIWIPELSTLYAADLAYNHVHSWGGIGVDRRALESWLVILDDLVKEYGRTGVRVIPGHGPESDANLLYAQRAYLRELIAAIDASKDDDAVRAAMTERFPRFAGREFQLSMTIQNLKALRKNA